MFLGDTSDDKRIIIIIAMSISSLVSELATSATPPGCTQRGFDVAMLSLLGAKSTPNKDIKSAFKLAREL